MVLQQLFERAVPFEVFAPNDQDVNKEKLLEIYNKIEIKRELINKIKTIDKKIYVLVFAELWCPDCIINLPALKKINSLNPNIVFRILPRDGNEEYMDNYKIAGKPKIPTFVVLNSSFEEKGAFIENPKVLRDIINKGNQVEIIVAKRKYQKGEYLNHTIEELVNIILK